MSVTAIDSALREVRGQAGGGVRRRALPLAGVRRSVPAHTFADWADSAPEFMEADLVARSGPTAEGSFVQTLTLTDIATGWTGVRAAAGVRADAADRDTEAKFASVCRLLLLRFDTDNDSVSMNGTVRDYCKAAGTECTRCRLYRKDDQAWVEAEERRYGPTHCRLSALRGP